MKLEVGMYARTLNGIVKIDKIQDNVMKDTKGYLHYGDFIKASHNIIDLIEVGDVLEINEEKYEVIYDESYEKLGILIPSRKELSIRHSALEYVFKKYEVSIITKQQFEQMSYKVGK